MSAAIFTYYTKNLNSVFLDNLNSLISNSDQQYDTIVICSQDAIPQQINKALYKTHRVIRIYPDLKGLSFLRRYVKGERFEIHPFFLTAISYSSADILTIFDSNLFIVNQLSAYSDCNLFYRTQTGQLSPSLFTIKTNRVARTMIETALSNTDFSQQLVLNQFSYVVANGMPLKPATISNTQFIFSNPGDYDPIIQNKLIALDFSHIDRNREIYRKMQEIRQSFLPKTTTLATIKRTVERIRDKHVATRREYAPSIETDWNYHILFKYTSRSRPDQFYRGLLSILENCNNSNFTVLCSFDENDPKLDRYNSIISEINSPNVKVFYGLSKNKVDAINRDLNLHDGAWEILINMSDDMMFTEYGFDELIRSDFHKHFKDLDGFIHYPDQNVGQKLATMSILGKAYYDRFRYIYHPDYTSLWCDNEAMEVSQILGKYKFIDDHFFDHLHPAYGKAVRDDQYAHTESFYNSDRVVFLKRQKNNFYL